MSDSLEHFMWGYQARFRSDVHLAVESVLAELGRPTGPTHVFLIGFLREGGTRRPICIEPADGALSRVDLEDAIRTAGEHARSDRGGSTDRVWRRSITETLEDRLEDRFFVSASVPVEEHRVYCAIGLERAVVEAFPALERGSLLDAALDHVSRRISAALYQPDPGAGPGLAIDADEVARQAGETFLLEAAERADPAASPAHGLFDALNRLATATYEKRTGVGRLILARPDAEGVDRQLILTTPVPMKETRSLRKLLETTRSTGAALLTSGRVAYGLGEVRPSYDPSTEEVFEVVVTGPGDWELRHDGQPLMAVTDGAPRLATARLGRDEFVRLADRLFDGHVGYEVDRLWELAQAASEAEHGTMLVISAQAAAEAARLSSQALLVEAVELSPALIRQVTSIDGAVLVDPSGVVTAIGAILDGSATGDGDRARGARYNSAVRYLATAPRGTMIVLVSEDGTLDLLPR